MTRAWSQFPRNNACTALNPPLQSEDPLRPVVNASANLLPTSRSLHNASAGPAHMGSLSPTSSGGMGQGTVPPSMGCIPAVNDISSQVPAKTTEPAQIPRRNLSEAFEELYVSEPSASSNTATPGVKQASGSNADISNLVSPTGVADLDNTAVKKTSNIEKVQHTQIADIAQSSSKTQCSVVELTPVPGSGFKEGDSFVVPYFYLPPDLKLGLSQAVVNRVSMYGVIHDINKEASAMAANDDSSITRNGDENGGEEFSPLVISVNGTPSKPAPSSDTFMFDMALIDDERWLLTAIEARGDDESRPNQACPPTFLQAMGEREYENPLASLSNGSRTQLWKPSRSWWEAKSGKNPWIEPKSHNKRWRYLWPLIHYHKFLAKCIKKLKRNGVDVKMSVSPVAAFLREEVCAVSDHLAAVSLFDSDEWMKCLEHFTGWTDASEESEARLRTLVSTLKLRPLNEPGDVDSALLRSQIDEQFLRAMVAARTQMEVSGEPSERRKATKGSNRSQNNQVRENCAQQASSDSMPSQQQNSNSPYQHAPIHVGNQHRSVGGVRRPRYPYQWWGQNYGGHTPYAFGDENGSVHSSVSGEAYNDFGMYQTGTPHAGYYPPVYPPSAYSDQPQPSGGYDPTVAEHQMHHMHDLYSNPAHAVQAGLGWVGHAGYDPNMAYALQQNPDSQGYYVTPGAPASPHEMHSPYPVQPTDGSMGCNPSIHMENISEDQTPYKYDPSQMPLSPFWAHLDRATLAMGLATPQTNPPKTPLREGEEKELRGDAGELSENARGNDAGYAGNAQPLLLRQSQYYGYGPYGPPSPATQFMMSPQASFAYNYGYGVSPSRSSSHGKGKLNNRSPAHTDPTGSFGRNGDHNSSEHRPNAGLSSPGLPRKQMREEDRESPSTVDTIAESESIQEAA